MSQCSVETKHDSGFRRKKSNNMQQKQMERLNTWCAPWDCREWSFNDLKVWLLVSQATDIFETWRFIAPHACVNIWTHCLAKTLCTSETEWISYESLIKSKCICLWTAVLLPAGSSLKDQTTPHQRPNYQLTIKQSYYEWITVKRDTKNAK